MPGREYGDSPLHSTHNLQTPPHMINFRPGARSQSLILGEQLKESSGLQVKDPQGLGSTFPEFRVSSSV